MPELPEVETARRAIARVAGGRRIVAVWSARDPLVMEGASPARLRRALLGRRVLAVHRHGKHLWLELDRRPWPAIHFGMSGGVHTMARPVVRLSSDRSRARTDGWPPRFAKLRLHFAGGGELLFTDARRLGRIRLRDDPPTEPPIRNLGFDAFRALPPPARFAALLRPRAAPIKAVLLDQSFAAGVGNWLADEVLYRARLDPRRPARTLTGPEAHRLRAALRAVIGTAVRLGADSDRFPRGWLFHVRWGRRAGSVTRRGEALRHDVIGGRTTAWAPAVQR